MVTGIRLGLAAILVACIALSAGAQDLVDLPSSASLAPASEITSFSPTPTLDRWYGSGEYVVWWIRQARAPVALTTSSYASRGLLGQPDTQVLYGGDRLETRHDDRFIGTRLRLGLWLDDDHVWAVEGNAFFLERDSTYFKRVSDGTMLLARPYINASDGSPGSEIIAGPTPAGIRSGGFQGYSRVELFGQEANVVRNLSADPVSRLDAIVGARFLQMRDRTDFTATGRLLPDQAILYGVTDHYRAGNVFYGGQLGLRASRQFGNLSLDARGLASLGANCEVIRTFGDRVYHTPLGRNQTPYGLTVQPSNAGRFEQTDLDAVYELGGNVGYQFTRHIKLFGGYTFLLWDSPIRSGDQVDNVLNLTPAAAGPRRPGIPFKEDVFWTQGVNVGLELTW